MQLRLRVDTFRPRRFDPKGFRYEDDCQRRATKEPLAKNQQTPDPEGCRSLSGSKEDKNLVSADVLRAGPSAYLNARGAVLDTLYESRWFHASVMATTDGNVVAQSHISAEERFWGKYWGGCRECLGFTWIEATLTRQPALAGGTVDADPPPAPGTTYCTRPTRLDSLNLVSEDPKQIVVALDIAAQIDHIDPRTAVSDDRSVPCGDKSWFEAIYNNTKDTGNAFFILDPMLTGATNP